MLIKSRRLSQHYQNLVELLKVALNNSMHLNFFKTISDVFSNVYYVERHLDRIASLNVAEKPQGNIIGLSLIEYQSPAELPKTVNWTIEIGISIFYHIPRVIKSTKIYSIRAQQCTNMSETFDPVTRTISKTVPSTNPQSLQNICRNTILYAVTLRRIDQADELLPLPKSLRRTVSLLNLHDFVIDAGILGASNHETQTYPAKCLIDGKQCLIKVQSKGSQPDKNNPSFIASFEYCDSICCVFEKTDCLEAKILQNKSQSSTFQESYIWKVIKGLVQYLLENNISTSAKINSSLIHMRSDGTLFLEKDEAQMTQVNMSPDSAIYEAPEVLRREEPTKQSFTWTAGCIIYEMLALEPAFYDRTGTNPFQVFMDMMQGTLPPEPLEGSSEIKSVMWNCLKLNPSERMPLQELLSMATSLCISC